MGGFTALYGGGRPYRNRALLLAAVAVCLSAAVGLGIWTSSVPLAGALTVAAIATVATLVCNALVVGPPGAYQFALVCAVGTGLHATHADPLGASLLVLACDLERYVAGFPRTSLAVLLQGGFTFLKPRRILLGWRVWSSPTTCSGSARSLCSRRG